MTEETDSGIDAADELIDCPKCHARMKKLPAGDVMVDRCMGCGGLWLDLMEKERLLADPKLIKSIDRDSAALGRHMDEQRQIKCPRDHSQLVAMSDPQQRHVHYESCTVCGGVFFDAGELADLSDYTLLERLRSMLG